MNSSTRGCMSVAQVECNRCQRTFDVSTEYFQKYGSDPFCGDCIVHTECKRCGCGLRLQPSRYQELGGDPLVCTNCNQQVDSSQAGKTSFWYGLTTGEKIVFPIVIVVGLMSLLVLYTEPNAPAEQVGKVVGICLFFSFWIVHRGEKNPNT